MERGSFCYFCGTDLVRVGGDDEGTCFECFTCPPVTHWRWNDDTEFLQLYVAGERCPYCGATIPDDELEQADPIPAPVKVEIPPAAAPVPERAEAETVPAGGQRRQGGKPVTVNDVWWESVVQWCRSENGHETRNHHNCSKDLARMQQRGDAEVVWHNRDRIPGGGELIGAP